jgi:hypothetical protein
MRRQRGSLRLLLAAATLTLAACGASADGRITARSATKLARWTSTSHIAGVLDLSSPRSDGTLVVASAGRLSLLHPTGDATRFATGPGGYSSPGGGEPYIALSPGAGGRGAGCTFGHETLYALRLVKGPGVTAIDAAGRARRFASLPGRGLENGIAFDRTGRFGHRLLVTSTAGSKTTVYGIDCRGAVTVVARDAPRVEGGIAVAPPAFGQFAGDLIAPDEIGGRIFAIGPDGHSRVVADSGLPHGPDLGAESLEFVPARLGAGWSVLVADRLTPGNPHPGDDVVLRIGAASLFNAGVRPGDLLITTEGGAHTDAITCSRSCRVRHVADGPPAAHVEGHIVFRAPRHGL